VDAETGDEVDSSDIIKGYEVGKGQYIEVEPEELEAIAIESKRTIEIDEFVPKKEIDELYLNSPYYLVPDGEVGQQAFAVIREAIRKEGMVALGRVVFRNEPTEGSTATASRIASTITSAVAMPKIVANQKSPTANARPQPRAASAASATSSCRRGFHPSHAPFGRFGVRQRCETLRAPGRGSATRSSTNERLGSRNSARERHGLFRCGAFGAACVAVHRSNIREWHPPRPE
jgi:hypothetical protein